MHNALRIYVSLWFAGFLAAAGVGHAEPQRAAGSLPTVGILVTHAPLTDPVMASIRGGLSTAGYEDGRNVRLEFVTAAGRLEELPALAEGLVKKNVDVILAPNELAARIAMKATKRIPIVMVAYGNDPVQLGIIDSLSRPGGNVTGIYSLVGEIKPKLVELLNETLPKATRIAVLRDPNISGDTATIEEAARKLKLQIFVIDVTSIEQLRNGLRQARTRKAQAAILMPSPLFYVNRQQVGQMIMDSRIPAITPFTQLVESGLLMSYGNDLDVIYRRMAYYVDRILKGTPASELPVEQVMRLTLAVNFKTADALRIKLPESILVRVDKAVR